MMSQRYKLDTVQRDEEIITFTLLMDYPHDYLVEQRHEPIRPFAKAQLHYIQREDLSKYHVNDTPLIKLVERKLEEITEESLLPAA